MGCYVLDFQAIDASRTALVGGKGTRLAELSRIDGVRVPPGFCVTTEAFLRTIGQPPANEELLDRLSEITLDDPGQIVTLSAEVRRQIERAAIPDEVAAAISQSVSTLGDRAACAVRSSATAEDLPAASFAGQHDTYLNVVGSAAILEHVSRCWASLFSERAVTYRLRHGLDHAYVRMAVVVQRMVFPQAAGVLFTADPLTGNRQVCSIEATFGLGESLVSGLLSPDVYKVRAGGVVAKAVAAKTRAVYASPGGGAEERRVEASRQNQSALTDPQIEQLARLGRRIEAHFGEPQDIEWCLAEDEFQLVQSRPITTLFPIPQVSDRHTHVYVSVGHQQMMTDPMKPLGISLWQLTTTRPMYEAAGRLFVDVADDLAAPAKRAHIMALSRSDPLIGDALQTILDRGGLSTNVPDEPAGAPPASASATVDTDPVIVTELIKGSQASIAALSRHIAAKSGVPLLDFILADLQELRRILFDPRSHQVIMAGMEASWWLNERLEAWLGEKDAVDTLTRSVPHNVTSEMGLALMNVADAIRPHPEVVAFLQDVENDSFLAELPTLPGGREAREAILAFLTRYGMRCVGEIDITRPRWSEQPSTLVPIILGNVKNFEPGAAQRLFEEGRQIAQSKEQEVLTRLRALPDGDRKAAETKHMIDRVRTFAGYREYPKYGMVSRYFAYKQALLAEARRLVQAGVLRDAQDIFYLTLEELREVVRTAHLDVDLVRQRQDAFCSYQRLTPPRVYTSEGEIITGSYRRDGVPPDSLVGLPVSGGRIEGRARVTLDIALADLEPGDILVTAYTDPSWTPLFVSIGGLVTEVGGLMTHGAVIAREYGLPAVVGVEHATELIPDGHQIRVDGTHGYVELLT